MIYWNTWNDIQYGHISAQPQVGIFNFNLGAIKEKKNLPLVIFYVNCQTKTLPMVMWILNEVGNALFVALM